MFLLLGLMTVVRIVLWAQEHAAPGALPDTEARTRSAFLHDGRPWPRPVSQMGIFVAD